MRFATFALAFLGLGGLGLADADPEPATPSAAPAAVIPNSPAPAISAATQASPPAASPAAASQPAAPKAAASALSADEQRLISQGYKPQMRNGEKIYCRREASIGSRISAGQHCGTAAELTMTTQESKDYLNKSQQNQLNPTIR